MSVKSKSSLNDFITNNIGKIAIGIVGSGISLAGIGAWFYTSVENTTIDRIAVKLEERHQIHKLPDGLEDKMKFGYSTMLRYDSTLISHHNYISYQQGANSLFLNNCDTIIIDGHTFHQDCNNELWIEYNGFIYQAVKQGHNWYIFLFQWQLPPGANNRLKL